MIMLSTLRSAITSVTASRLSSYCTALFLYNLTTVSVPTKFDDGISFIEVCALLRENSCGGGTRVRCAISNCLFRQRGISKLKKEKIPHQASNLRCTQSVTCMSDLGGGPARHKIMESCISLRGSFAKTNSSRGSARRDPEG